MINIVKDLSVEHVLMFVIVAFLLYHLIGGCSCGMLRMRSRDGFSVGGKRKNKNKKDKDNSNVVYCDPTLKQMCPPGNIACPDCGKDSCPCPTPAPSLPIPPYVILTDIDGIEEKIEFKDYSKDRSKLLIEINITNSHPAVDISPIINPSNYSGKIWLAIMDLNKSSQLQKLPEDFLYGLVDAEFTDIYISLENGYIGRNFFKQIKFSGDTLFLETLDNASVVKGLITDVHTQFKFGKNITPNMDIDGLGFSSCKLKYIEYEVLKKNKFQHCSKKK